MVAILIFAFFNFEDSFAATSAKSKNDTLIVNFQPNPDEVDAGKKIKFLVMIKSQDYPSFVSTIGLITPWNDIYDTINKTIETNRTFFKEIEYKVPSNASNGKYLFNLLVDTPKSDYTSVTEVTVKKIQSIPLSGDIPLSVLVIIFSGIITYIIPIFLLTRKFERNYIEVTIFSVGLGLLNWLILNTINIVGDWGIISDEPKSIGLLLLFSIGMGLAIFLVFRLVIIPLYNRIESRDISRRRILNLRRVGYTPSENIWRASLGNELDFVKNNLGRGYSLALRVTLKSDPTRQIEGILQHYERNIPHDLVLSPNYTVLINNRNDLINLLAGNDSPLLKELNDKKYRKRMIEYLVTFEQDDDAKEQKKKTLVRDKNNNTIIQELGIKLTQAGPIQNFLEILDKIDFTRYAGSVIARLKTNTNLAYSYQKIFISGDDISRVEVRRYQCAYVVALNENNTQHLLPKVYERDEFFFVVNRLLK